MNLEFIRASDIKAQEEPQTVESQKVLNHAEIAELEKTFKYSFVMYESDILRFRFDITQFKPNVAYETQFLDLIPLYNEYYYKYSREFLNLYKKEFTVIKVQGREATFLLLLTNSDKGANRIKDLSKMKSFKYKANFTKAERSLLYKLRNFSYVPNYMESYLKTLEDELQEVEDQLQEKEEIYKIYSNFIDNLKTTKDPRKEVLRGCTEYLYDDMQELKEEIKTIKKKIDSYLFSISEEETTLEDY